MESLVRGFGRGDGDVGGGCAHRNRCPRAKAAIAGSDKYPANKAFAARAAITVAVVWLWGGVVGVAVVVVENDGRCWP